MINSSNFSVFQRLFVMMPLYFFRSSGLATLISRVAMTPLLPPPPPPAFILSGAGISFLISWN